MLTKIALKHTAYSRLTKSFERLGTGLKTLALKNFSFPKVHPNILGPGLAQVVKHEKTQIKSIDSPPGPSSGLDKKSHERPTMGFPLLLSA